MMEIKTFAVLLAAGFALVLVIGRLPGRTEKPRDRFVAWSVSGLAAILALVLLGTVPAHAIEPDKQGHLVVGAAIGSAFTLVEDRDLGMLAGCGAGAAKELYDSLGYGHAEFADFAFTCAGAIGASYATDQLKVWLDAGGLNLQFEF